MKLPRPANHYKKEYSLYRAAMRVMEHKPTGWQWWVQNCKTHCQDVFPEFLPLITELFDSYSPATLGQLKPKDGVGLTYDELEALERLQSSDQ
jgi:hypothetical protein